MAGEATTEQWPTAFPDKKEPGVPVSTIKKAEDDNSIVIRLFDYSGENHNADLKSYFPFKRIVSTDILKKGSVELPDVKMHIRPFSIETFKLR